MDIQQDSTHIPQIEDFYAVIHNKLFEKFLQAMKDIFSCEPQMEFSRCTWEYGWNMKFKKEAEILYPVCTGAVFHPADRHRQERSAVFGSTAAAPR